MELKNSGKNSQKYECESCYYFTSRKSDYIKHISTAKHKKTLNLESLELNGIEKIATLPNTYECKICLYNTGNKGDFIKHNHTTKHIKNSQRSVSVANDETIKINHICIQCNKEFNTQSGLWKHNKKCIINKTEELLENKFTPSNVITSELVIDIIKQSKELQEVLIEQNKELQHKLLQQNTEHDKQIIELAKNQSVVNNNNNTTNNNQFNLQFYLNETCKDAMNIVDFVNSLQLTTDDFENTGKLGFVDGISRIFIKELKKIDTEKLPIHCTDFKRETVYIKDNNTWEKENDEKKKLKWTIDKIAKLNYNQIQQWQEKFPECRENNTPANEHFFRLTRVALGGYGKEEADKFRDKIMRNVLKEVVLDKKQRNIQSV
jgi:hypothetical protein